MIRPLMVGVSHGLDLITFMAAVAWYNLGIEGEANLVVRAVYAVAGIAGVVLLKVAGAAALAFIAHIRAWALLPAVGSGLVGASVNLISINIMR